MSEEEAVNTGESLVDDYLDVIVKAMGKSETKWTSGSAYFDLSREILENLESEIENGVVENNRPEVIQGIKTGLKDSGRFEVEKKDPQDPEDPVEEYQRLVLKEE
jgi:hypothetical protein